MKLPNLNRAFGETPECVRAAIEAGFLEGMRAAAYGVESAPIAKAREGEALRSANPHKNASEAGAHSSASPDANLFETGARRDEARAGASAPDRNAARPSPALRAARAAARKRKILNAAGIAAVLTLTLGLSVFSAGRLNPPRPDSFQPVAQPDGGAGAPPPGSATALARGREATAQLPGPQETVYAAEGGRYYHAVPDCSGMQGARALSAQEAEAAGKRPCPICIGGDGGAEVADATPAPTQTPSVRETDAETPADATPAPTQTPSVRETDAGTPETAARGESAVVPALPAMEAAVDERAQGADGDGALWVAVSESSDFMEAEAPATDASDTAGFIAFTLEDAVFATDRGRYFHALADCSGMEGARAMTLADAMAMGKGLCPNCFGMERAFATEGGRYYHIDPECSGMENARLTPIDDARARGQKPCPTCIGDAIAFAEQTTLDFALAESDGASESAHAELWFEVASDSALPAQPAGDASETALPDDGTPLNPSPEEAAVGGAESPIFYYTANGVWFHLSPNCSGMQNAGAHTLRELFQCGKLPCPACFADESARALYRIPAPEGDASPVLVPVEPGVSGCFHRDPFCFGMSACYQTTLARARDFQNLGPCPACLPDLAGETDPMPCVVDADGAYYHLRDDCPRLGGGAQETTRLQAQASGRMHCPDCAALSPDGADRFEALFGFGINEIEEGFRYERTDLRADGAREWFLSDGVEIDSLGFYAPDGAGGGTLSVGYASQEYGDSSPFRTIPPEFFARTPEPLYSLERVSAQAALEACLAEPDLLQEVLSACWSASLRFDADCNVTACMLRFAAPEGHCVLGWEADESGGFRLAYRRCYGESWTQAAQQEKIGS